MKFKIIRWIKQQLRDAKAKGIVLGLSGGIDSAVCASLVKEAVGENKLLCLMLPCHSSRQDLADASYFARKFGIRVKGIDLTKAYDSLIRLLPVADGLARHNLKPRLRMAVLYYFANKMNYLVCGTGNKSELKVGYFTKFGDGAVDILPLGDLFKMQVMQLAQELGVPERIISRSPTAGLWPGQTDEREMGIRYAQLDDILWRLENNKPQIAARAKVNRVKAMLQRSAHKRQGPRICQMKPQLMER
jgi:NAD+ synthase